MSRLKIESLLILAAAGLAPALAQAQNVVPLDGPAIRSTTSATGSTPDAPATQDIITPDGNAYRVSVFGAEPRSSVAVSQNLMTTSGAAPVPNVNDCTFIRDPIALRDCINLYEGQRLGPGPRTSALQPALITDKALLNAAGPIPASPGGRSDSGRERPTPSQPGLSDVTFIEQVKRPR